MGETVLVVVLGKVSEDVVVVDVVVVIVVVVVEVIVVELKHQNKNGNVSQSQRILG